METAFSSSFAPPILAAASIRRFSYLTQHRSSALPIQISKTSKRSSRPLIASCSASSVSSTVSRNFPEKPVASIKETATDLTQNLRGDLFGGFTAAVVALPLALAFGVASGAGPLAGLYGAMFAGFFAALFGGTPSQVTGPTGPMTVVAATIFATFSGDPAVAFSVVFLSGVLQVIMGAMKLGQFIRLVPAPVISGFMSGIGCIIFSTQLLPLCGLKGASSVMGAVQAVPQLLSAVNLEALFIGILSFALCTFTPKKITKIIPGSLLALAAGTIITMSANLNIPLLGHIPSKLPMPLGLKFPAAMMPMMLKSSIILALLGTIDSLLTSLVADNLTDTYHDSNQELVGQGIGNAIAGLFGGIPSAGATMRTVVNIRSGGKTRLAGMFHSLLLLGIVMGGGKLAKNIPLAALAGILMKTGWDIIDKKFISQLPKLPASTGIVMWTVLLVTVFVDLIVAVGTGCVLASLLLVNQMSISEVDKCSIVTSKEIEAGTLCPGLTQLEKSMIKSGGDELGLVVMRGSFTFSAANGILRKVVSATMPLDIVVLDLSGVTLIDGDAVLALETLVEKAERTGKLFLIAGASMEIGELIEKVGLKERLFCDPSTERVKALYLALRETGSGNSELNNAVKLRRKSEAVGAESESE